MFICSTCHGENKPYRFSCDPQLPIGSFGPCEVCKKVKGCADCHEGVHKIIKPEEKE